MTASQRKAWEEIQTRGHDRFILRELLQAGIPMGLAISLGMYLTEVFTSHATKPLWEFAVDFGFLALVFGYGMGESRWRKCERDYQKKTDDDPSA